MVSVEPPSRRTRNHRWLWFFGALLCLSAAALLFPFFYARMRMLDGEKLARARALWAEHKPRSYRLEVTMTMPGDPSFTSVITVRDGKTESQRTPSGEDVAPTEADPVASQFDLMQTILDGLRTGSVFSSTAVDFDPKDGHPLYFYYRNPDFHQIVELRVLRFEPLPEE
jgi:hypothetical protein